MNMNHLETIRLLPNEELKKQLADCDEAYSKLPLYELSEYGRALASEADLRVREGTAGDHWSRDDTQALIHVWVQHKLDKRTLAERMGIAQPEPEPEPEEQ